MNVTPLFRYLLSPACILLCLISIACTDSDTTTPPADTEDEAPLLTYLALGDSYTIGESVPEAGRYPVQLAATLQEQGYNVAAPDIIATTGWTTRNLLNALEANPPADTYDLVTLLIGVNNQFQGRSLEEYEGEFTELLDSAIHYAGGDKDRVIVVSIPDYGYTPFGSSRQEQISEGIDNFNIANKRLTEARGIAYVNITPISRRGLDETDLVATDNLHPSAKQYGEWVELLLPVTSGILAEE